MVSIRIFSRSLEPSPSQLSPPRFTRAVVSHSPTHGQSTEQLVTERLGLSSGRKTAELDLLGVELERVLGELETLLDESLELADTASLVTEDILGVGGTDDNLGTGVGDTDFTARVTLGGELTGAVELVCGWGLGIWD